jgi:hypothetical protein
MKVAGKMGTRHVLQLDFSQQEEAVASLDGTQM